MRYLIEWLPRWSLIVFALLVFLSAAVAIAAPTGAPVAQEGDGIGVDPLSPEEAARALQAVQTERGAQSATVRASKPQSPGQEIIEAPLEETVLVERHPEEKAVMASGQWERKADVFIYRYEDDTLVHAVYNYATGSAQQVEEVQGVQFPLTAAERALAVDLAFGDPAALAHMQEEYLHITGEELFGPDQVDIRVFVYHAGANPETETPEVAACGIQRCAQLLILTDDNVTFEALPIVNLSTMSVASVVPVAIETSVAPGSQPSAPHGNGH